jgi:hypothetical protein
VESSTTQRDLLDEALERLRELIGPNLEINPHIVGVVEPANLTGPRSDSGADALVTVRDPHGGGYSLPILVEAKQSITPSELETRLRPRVELMRRLNGDAAVLVVAPWLSPRTRQALDDLAYGYLDLTGNVSFRLHRPAIRLRLDGARRDPAPGPERGPSRLRGGKAGRLVRVLVDVRPPYRGVDLSRATGLSLPYVSRLLDTLREQALITRRGRAITDVDWSALLRVRAEARALLKVTAAVPMLAPAGQAAVLERLRDLDDPPAGSDARPLLGTVSVTGSAAAAAVAPIAVGGQLMVYVGEPSGPPDREDRIEGVRRALGLLHADREGDVLLLTPDDPVVFTGTRTVDGTPHVALSQLVMDCLAGPGRLPAEGEELLRVMERGVEEWRLSDLADWQTLNTTAEVPG